MLVLVDVYGGQVVHPPSASRRKGAAAAAAAAAAGAPALIKAKDCVVHQVDYPLFASRPGLVVRQVRVGGMGGLLWGSYGAPLRPMGGLVWGGGRIGSRGCRGCWLCFLATHALALPPSQKVAPTPRFACMSQVSTDTDSGCWPLLKASTDTDACTRTHTHMCTRTCAHVNTHAHERARTQCRLRVRHLSLHGRWHGTPTARRTWWC